MIGPTLALLTRSLRGEARSLLPHLARLAMLGIICFMLAMTGVSSTFLSAPGLNFFSSLCWLDFVFITLAGMSWFATAISEEKDEETLGLLKMAGISPVALLLGKSTSRMLSAILILSLQFPFTLLAITLGGVLWGQVISAYIALAAYLVFVANLSLFCSVCSRNSAEAARMAVGGLLLSLMGPFIAGLLVPAMGLFSSNPGWMENATEFSLSVLSHASTPRRLSVILSTGYAGTAFGALQVWAHLTCGLLFFLISWAIFEDFTRTETGSPRESRRAVKTIKGQGPCRARHGRAWNNALVWKDFHFIAGGIRLVLSKAALYGTLAVAISLVWLWSETPSRLTLFEIRQLIGGLLMGAALVVAPIELIVAASRVFSSESRGRTLPLLEMLPLSRQRVLLAKVGGCLLGLITTAIYFMLGVACYPEGFYAAASGMLSWPAIMMVFHTLAQFALCLSLTAYLSLVVKWGAIPLALVLVYVIQGIGLSIVMSILFLVLRNTFGDVSVAYVFFSVCLTALTAGMVFLTGRKLKQLAAE